MRPALVGCAIVALSGCYDLGSFPKLYRGDGGTTPSYSKLDLFAGAIGGGGYAMSGQPGGPRLDDVYGICSDGVSTDTFYVTDRDSRTLSSLSTEGTLTLLAGVPYLSGHADGVLGKSTFTEPRGCVVSGNTIYIADASASTIRAYDLSEKTLATVVGSYLSYGPNAGGGKGQEAQLGYLSQLALAGTTLYAIDFGLCVLDIIDTTTLSIQSVGEGCGTTAWSTAMSLPGNQLLMRTPAGVTVSGSDIYIADTNNNVILQMQDHPPFDTVVYAGVVGDNMHFSSGPPLMTGVGMPQSLAFSPDGSTLYATDSEWGLHEITSTMVTNPLIATNFGLAVLANGDVLFGEPGIHAVDRVPSSQPEQRLVQSPETEGTDNGPTASAKLSKPLGMRAVGDTLYVADTGNHAIRTISSKLEVATLAGSYLVGNDDGAAAQATFNFPADIAVGSDGTVYVADSAQRNIRAISNGMVSTFAGQNMAQPLAAGLVNAVGTAARFNTPRSIAIIGDTLYVADDGNHVVRTVDISNNPTRASVGTFTIANPTSLLGCNPTGNLEFAGLAADDAHQTLYAAISSQCSIAAIDVGSGMATIVAGGTFGAQMGDGAAASARFEDVGLLAFDGGHTLYASDDAAALVLSIDLDDKAVHVVAGTAQRHAVVLGTLPAQLNQASGLAPWQGVGLMISVPAENAILYAH